MKKYIAFFVCVCAFFISCKEEIPKIEVSQTSIEAESEGGSFVIQVSSNVEWSLLCNEDWIKPKREAADGGYSINVRVLKNDTPDGRTGQIKLSSPEVSTVVTVSQKQQNKIIVEGETLINLTEQESVFTVATQSNIQYSVEIPIDAAWLKVDGDTKAMIPGTINFKVTANTSHESRFAEVKLTADKCEPVVLKITQMGCVYGFDAYISNISTFPIPALTNNDYPAKVIYGETEIDYTRNMLLDVDEQISNKVRVEGYQISAIKFTNIVGLDSLDFFGM